jgi:glyoxylase-like metal-dependent hydrolase (beta-lactamase superfamily II)
MQVDCRVMGDFGTNGYCVRASPQAAECIIIDPGLGAEELLDFVREHSLQPVWIILTHGHIDHIAGVDLFRQHFPPVQVAIHQDDSVALRDPDENLSLMLGTPFDTDPADRLLKDRDILDLAGIHMQVLHTPGHTRGGICLYCEKDNVLFAGDTLFAGSIGRTDFPGGDYSQLIRGIREKILILPPRTLVYTGHGPTTTIEQEKQDNPYLQD